MTLRAAGDYPADAGVDPLDGSLRPWRSSPRCPPHVIAEASPTSARQGRRAPCRQWRQATSSSTISSEARRRRAADVPAIVLTTHPAEQRALPSARPRGRGEGSPSREAVESIVVEVARVVQRQSPELIPLRRHVASWSLAALLIRRRYWLPLTSPLRDETVSRVPPTRANRPIGTFDRLAAGGRIELAVDRDRLRLHRVVRDEQLRSPISRMTGGSSAAEGASAPRS